MPATSAGVTWWRSIECQGPYALWQTSWRTCSGHPRLCFGSALKPWMPATSAGMTRGGRLPPSPIHMPVEEPRDLLEGFARLRRVRIDGVLRMRKALEHLQVGVDAGAAQLAVGAHRQAQIQVARTRGQDRRRKAFEVGIDRRQHRIFQVVPVGVED